MQIVPLEMRQTEPRWVWEQGEKGSEIDITVWAGELADPEATYPRHFGIWSNIPIFTWANVSLVPVSFNLKNLIN